MPLLCLKGFIREPKPPKKGIRVLMGILASLVLPWKVHGLNRASSLRVKGVACVLSRD